MQVFSLNLIVPEVSIRLSSTTKLSVGTGCESICAKLHLLFGEAALREH